MASICKYIPENVTGTSVLPMKVLHVLVNLNALLLPFCPVTMRRYISLCLQGRYETHEQRLQTEVPMHNVSGQQQPVIWQTPGVGSSVGLLRLRRSPWPGPARGQSGAAPRGSSALSATAWTSPAQHAQRGRFHLPALNGPEHTREPRQHGYARLMTQADAQPVWPV